MILKIIPFMVQNKTQIISNTHKYKTIVSKIHESHIIHTSLYAMFCEMWHHLHNLKNLKNTHGEVLLLVKLQAKRKSENMTCNIFDEKI